MIGNLLFPLALLGMFVQCAQQNSNGVRPAENVSKQAFDELKTGLKIENGINRGIGYTDSGGTKYNLRYIPITVKNENAIPVQLQLVFSKSYSFPKEYGTGEFNVIPLPKKWASDGVEITDSMTNKLASYIDKPSLNKTLEPGEELVFAIGTLYLPTGVGVLPKVLLVTSDNAKAQGSERQTVKAKSNNPQTVIGLKLSLHLAGERRPSKKILIPCGKISFPER